MVRFVNLVGPLLTLFFLVPAPVRAGTLSVKLGEEKPKTVRGLIATQHYWFELSRFWTFSEPSTFRLAINHSPVLVPELSSLTVLVNETAVYSLSLDESNVQGTIVEIKIPPRAFNHDSTTNQITLTAKMRSDKEICEDVRNPALWFNVLPQTQLFVRYDEPAIEPDLGEFPGSYWRPEVDQRVLRKRSPVPADMGHFTLVLPSDPSREALEAAAVIAARFGNETAYRRGRIDVRFLSSVGADTLAGQHIIAVGTYKDLAPLLQLGVTLPFDLETASRDDAGRVAEVRNPIDPARRILVVTGRDSAALTKATTNLAMTGVARLMYGPVEVFHETQPLPVDESFIRKDTHIIRLADLKLSDRDIRGKFFHYTQFVVPNPYVGRVKGAAYLRLQMSYSDLLIPQSSSMLITVNDHPIRSYRLTPDKADGVTLDVAIPEHLLLDRQLSFGLEFFLDIGDTDCLHHHPEMAWVTISSQSFVFFPLQAHATENLSTYPWSLIKSPNLNNLLLLLDLKPSESEVRAMVNVSAFLGRNVFRTEWLYPRVQRLGAVSEEDRKSHDMIVLARTSVLAQQRVFTDRVPGNLLGVRDAGVKLESYVVPSFLRRSGWLHLRLSPWNDALNLLLASGTKAEQVELASAYLSDEQWVYQLRGSTLLAGPRGATQVVQPAPDEARAAAARVEFTPPSQKTAERQEEEEKILAQQEHPVPAESSTTAALLIFFLLTPLIFLLVILRIRSARPVVRAD